MSLNAATIEYLLEKGMTGDDLLEVARRMEKRADPTNATRQARHRAKRKAGKDNGVTVTPVTPPNDNTLTPREVSEPEGSSPQPWVCLKDVDPQVWVDFRKNRKRKRLPDTDTAWKGFLDDLARVSAQTGIPPPELIKLCTAKGWGAIYDPNGRSQTNDRPDNPTAIAVQRLTGAFGPNG